MFGWHPCPEGPYNLTEHVGARVIGGNQKDPKVLFHQSAPLTEQDRQLRKKKWATLDKLSLNPAS